MQYLKRPLLVMTIAAGSAAALAAAWERLRVRTLGGPIIAALADGTLLAGRLLRTPLVTDRRIKWTRIGSRDGAGDPDWEFSWLSLSPTGQQFAVQTVETFSGGMDMRVSVHNSSTGAVLVSRTDNSYPTTLYSGDDPEAPATLLEEQAYVDADWEEWRLEDPTIPRPIVTGRFVDPAADGELFPAGWTAAGHCLLIGHSRVEIVGGPTAGHITDPAPWWGVLGPLPVGSWGWIEQGAGSPPATHAAVARPTLTVDVIASDGQLRVNGVVQTDAVLAPGVDAVDGPFS